MAIMSEARNLARALNLSHRDGLDMMGGADAEAIGVHKRIHGSRK